MRGDCGDGVLDLEEVALHLGRVRVRVRVRARARVRVRVRARARARVRVRVRARARVITRTRVGAAGIPVAATPVIPRSCRVVIWTGRVGAASVVARASCVRRRVVVDRRRVEAPNHGFGAHGRYRCSGVVIERQRFGAALIQARSWHVCLCTMIERAIFHASQHGGACIVAIRRNRAIFWQPRVGAAPDVAGLVVNDSKRLVVEAVAVCATRHGRQWRQWWLVRFRQQAMSEGALQAGLCLVNGDGGIGRPGMANTCCVGRSRAQGSSREGEREGGDAGWVTQKGP